MGSSLAVVDGNPAIVSRDNDSHKLKYYRSTTSTGAFAADWTQVVEVDSNVSIFPISLAAVNGNPAIAYRDDWNDTLKYVRATTSNGGSAADWSQRVEMDEVGAQASLSLINGNPAISYCGGDDDLRYVRATTATGADSDDWADIQTPDSGGNVGKYSSLASVNGNPAISYLDFTNWALKYAYYIP